MSPVGLSRRKIEFKSPSYYYGWVVLIVAIALGGSFLATMLTIGVMLWYESGDPRPFLFMVAFFAIAAGVMVSFQRLYVWSYGRSSFHLNVSGYRTILDPDARTLTVVKPDGPVTFPLSAIRRLQPSVDRLADDLLFASVSGIAFTDTERLEFKFTAGWLPGRSLVYKILRVMHRLGVEDVHFPRGLEPKPRQPVRPYTWQAH